MFTDTRDHRMIDLPMIKIDFSCLRHADYIKKDI